jgi:hypothetical protein
MILNGHREGSRHVLKGKISLAQHCFEISSHFE